MMSAYLMYLIIDSALEGVESRLGRAFSFIRGYEVGRSCRLECTIRGVLSYRAVCTGIIVRVDRDYVVVNGDIEYLDHELLDGNYTWWLTYDDISSVVWE